ncbi:helix-turn-helix domain-containing protein [Embleya sp. NPDC059259]|uniref:helix-turn-helix domain-containing protein n=1 Tax=unclassified Embleya TaxID=2699296 RepID=UPI00369451D8
MAAEMDPSSSFAALFGKRLARLRKAKGMTQQELAADLHVHFTRVSQIERALSTPPTLRQAQALDEVLEADGLFVDLWDYVYRERFPDWSRAFMSLAELASVIREYTAHHVPGLLQTEAYARAILRTARSLKSEAQLEKRLAARLSRQDRLVGPDAPWLEVVLDEAVLQRIVGGRDVMLEQLDHVATMARRPNISVQVLCFVDGEHEAMGGSLTVLTLPDGTEAAYTEGADYGRLVEEQDDVAEYFRAYDRVKGLALPPRMSLDMIETTMECI